MVLNEEQNKKYEGILTTYKSNEMVLKMKEYPHHGAVSIFDHCEHVARLSYYLSIRWKWKVNYEDLIIGAFLHDFYLYNWHNVDDGSHKLHGYRHPGFAYENAKKQFNVNDKVKMIIKTHMWPLTLFSFPKSKEAFIVCYADKYCTIIETLFQRKKVKPIC